MVYLPLCCSSSEGSLGLALARLLMEGFLWLDVESVRQGALCFTNLEPVVCCDVGRVDDILIFIC